MQGCAVAFDDAECLCLGQHGAVVGDVLSDLRRKQRRDLVKCLDVLIKNRFRNKAEVLGAWKMASHVTSTGGGGEEEPPPTPPAP
jgi:hypothetical protein